MHLRPAGQGEGREEQESEWVSERGGSGQQQHSPCLTSGDEVSKGAPLTGCCDLRRRALGPPCPAAVLLL